MSNHMREPRTALSKHGQMLADRAAKAELARREEVWRKWHRGRAMFPSLLEGDRGACSPLGGQPSMRRASDRRLKSQLTDFSRTILSVAPITKLAPSPRLPMLVGRCL